jgi:hypothetical protein
MTLAFTLLAFCLLLGVYLRLRPVGTLGILDVAIVFLVMRYGPHVLWIPESMAYFSLGRVTPAEHLSYMQALGLAYLGLTLGLLAGVRLAPQAFQAVSGAQVRELKSTTRAHFLMMAGLYLGLFIGACVVLDAGGFFQRITESLRYILSTSDFSYEQIRRELFAESASMALLGRTRYSVTAAVIACLFAVRRPKAWFDKADFLVVGLFVFCALTLNKQIFFHYLILFGLVRLFYAEIVLGQRLNLRLMAWLAVGVVGVLGFILFLYSLQYRDNVASGIATQADFIRVLMYRLFYTSGDAVQLVVATYPDYAAYVGLNSIGLLASLLGLEYRDPTLEMVAIHLGSFLTSIQPGFIGSAYAAFGAVGVLINALLVGLLITFWEQLKHSLKTPELVVAYTASMALASYFLTSPQFHLSLLTGGGLVIPFFFVALNWWLNRKPSLQA